MNVLRLAFMQCFHMCSHLSFSFVAGPGAMAKDPLAEAGFYFDELNKLRVLEPDVSQRTSELKEECKEFVDSMQKSFSWSHDYLFRNVFRDVHLFALFCFFARDWPVSEGSGKSNGADGSTFQRSGNRKDEGQLSAVMGNTT